MKDYFLMIEDAKLAVFSIRDDNIVRVLVNEKATSLLPFGVRDASSVGLWLRDRVVPNTRQGIEKDLGGRSTFEFMLENYGLSLTDNYWVKPVDSMANWGDVNLFDNPFTDCLFFKTIFDKEEECLLPNSSLKGDLRKKWVVGGDGIRRLVKVNKNSDIQALNEVLASKICNMQGFKNYTSYYPITVDVAGKKVLGCYCPNFVHKGEQLVHANEVVGSGKKSNSESYFQYYVRKCIENGIKSYELQHNLDFMFMLDFLMSNNDRHLRNMGVLRDGGSMRFTRVAPIFDTGNSMFYHVDYIPKSDKGILGLECESFYYKQVRLLSLVVDRRLFDLSRLPSKSDLYSLYRRSESVSEERLDKMITAFFRKAELLEDFQKGKDIWKYRV